ncbi:2-hydroxyacid dehydrogenase [Yersinia enterocolitica]|uniref:2-hydroxyacid dehydrogenase n=1 Tax=Yersinia enterocolitica TaxID=630 RepID=UPI00061C27E1|nr:2-hydroxyacid dehydrogenase [Yersinia enterocolitica]EKN4739514.1 2-hydroxyacid dehydrogenase [Yersinia enterocolitica]EKN4923533.1 dihydrofolate reductase [Yersinia enterocolitica]EKN6155235.1 dihydrofolate reductase [Yersinia enterocolitica]EKN6173948.1 dihydrofolate reductase [Yersinia enterocolitica]ELI8021520.1 2-hydroxyacid dehydrogenase [Yersinia enterocolitica]
MKTLFTAEYAGSLDHFHQLGELVISGWAAGKPKLSEEQLIALGHDADFLVTSYDDITARVIKACPQLKLIACTRANPVNIDVNAATERGIPVIYTPGRNSDAAAELTIALMLNLARHIPQAHSALKQGQFTANAPGNAGLKTDVVWDVTKDSPYEVFKGVELRNKTLGIVGYGSIGQRVGRIARAFGMRLLVADPYVSEVELDEPGIHKTTLELLFSQSDFVTLHVKVTPQTEGLIDAHLFSLMKPEAYFINTSRAAVVVEQHLVDALRRKQLAGAALDVYAHEPIHANHPFIHEFDNVVITPHIAGATHETLVKHTAMIAQDIERFLRNEPLLYRYN